MPSDRAAVPPPAAAPEELAASRLAAELGPFAAGRIDAARLAGVIPRQETNGEASGAPATEGGERAGRLLERLSELDDPAGRLAAWLLQEADRAGADPAGGPDPAGGGASG